MYEDKFHIERALVKAFCVVTRKLVRRSAFLGVIVPFSAVALLLPIRVTAQSVCLPAPRLLTTMPMGGQIGTTVPVTITGVNLENVEELIFSHSKLTALPQKGEDGLPIENQFLVTIAADCPEGLYEARVMSRLGVSTSRIFHVGSLPETNQIKPNTSLEQAMPVAVNSICNATMTRQAIDFYSFEATQGQRIIIECAAKGMDSKLNAVLIVADAAGNDLLVERRGGVIDFTAPAAGTYLLKVHDLTFNGDAYHFYRLALRELAVGAPLSRLPATHAVNTFSWPPAGLRDDQLLAEVEPNNKHSDRQKISLPCDISGSFFPAADVDTFEFTAKKGEVWWVEVASERLGCPTDPSMIVQHVNVVDGVETLTDLVEFTDIGSPVKVSSNGYSYDGPPYNAGSSDFIGKLEIKEDGVHRMQLLDLFGGTRNDPRNVYRLVVRKAEPDFALVSWALHMNLRNGDRNALSKPIALRGGATMPLEVIVVRRDGFDGVIELFMEDLPSGVTAQGLHIPAGKSSGMMLITADENAPRGLSQVKFYGQARINEESVTRVVRHASMAWPVPDAWGEIPIPRLQEDLLVSVCESEQAPITIAAGEDKVWEVVAGQKLTIPLSKTLRSDFSGPKLSLKAWGSSFDKAPAFEVPFNTEPSEVTLDLGTLKTPPGDYTIAFYGSPVAKYQYHPQAVTVAEAVLRQAQEKVTALTEEVKSLTEAAQTAAPEQKPELEKSAQVAIEKHKQAEAAVKVAETQLKTATDKAKPKDIVDILVSKPIAIRVIPAEEASSK